MVFTLNPSTPLENYSSLASYFPLKILAFETPHPPPVPPPPSEFPVSIHGEGMDIFWNNTIIMTIAKDHFSFKGSVPKIVFSFKGSVPFNSHLYGQTEEHLAYPNQRLG